VEELTDNLVVSSKEISSRPFLFWAKAFCTTALSWSSRYLVANALFLAFSPANNQLLIFARQLILWITMIISPTPGGSGIGEYMFKEYYSDLFQNAGIVLVVTFLWRIISYYVYLLIGICIVPKWIKDI
jgi:Predicted integral membrane protein